MIIIQKHAKCYCNISRDAPNANIEDSELFKFKAKITEINPNSGNTKDVEKNVPLKHLKHLKLYQALEVPLTN